MPNNGYNIIYIFNELGILTVDESSGDNLRVIFNEDSLIVQSFQNFKRCFEDEAYRNSNVCGAFVALDSGVLKDQENTMINMFDELTAEERLDFYNLIEDYENFELSDDPVLSMAQKSLIAQLKDLDEAGKLDKFRDYVKRNLYI